MGKVAPEIAGKDHEGNSFALSDSRGKVVVLTFSGNWCGPCVAMYPQERALVAKLEGQAVRSGEREHGRGRGDAQDVNRVG